MKPETFKPGDRVTMHGGYCSDGIRDGAVGTITAIREFGVSVRPDIPVGGYGREWGFRREEVRHVIPAEPGKRMSDAEWNERRERVFARYFASTVYDGGRLRRFGQTFPRRFPAKGRSL